MVMSGVWLVLVVLIWLMLPSPLVVVVVVVLGFGSSGAVFRGPSEVTSGMRPGWERVQGRLCGCQA